MDITPRVISVGEEYSTIVTVKNEGNLAENVKVTVTCGSTTSNQKTLSIDQNTEENITFILNTTGFTPNTYTVTARLEMTPGETNLANNTNAETTVEIVEPGSSINSESNFLQSNLPTILLIASATACAPVILFAVKRKKGNATKKSDFLYEMLGGSIPAGSTILVLGEAGSGKSTLCQDLTHRFLEEQRACLFASYDELPSDIKKSALSFGWNFPAFEEKNALSFIDCYAPAAKTKSKEKYSVEQPFSLTDLSIAISTALEDLGDKPKSLILDSATSLFTKIDIQKVLRFLQDRSARIKANKDIFIFALGKETMATNFANRLEDAVDGVIELEFVEENQKRVRRMRIKKLRGQSHLENWHVFTIKPNKGIAFL